LFLLDGLDEIIETGQRREIARRIEEFARDHSQCRMIVTSRIVGYREVQLGGAFVQFTISPFADEDIRRFAEKWYAALEVPDDAKQLVQAIQENPSVRRLAANPLLLTVIALIHWRGAKLPHHRVTLYRVAAETLVDQWMSYRRVSPEGWDVHETLQVLLPATAWHLRSTTSSGLIGEQELHNLLVETLQQHDPRLSENAAHSRASQFRRNVSEFSGIFLERGLDQDGRGLYGFLHLTFEEYFTAVHLADQWERGGKSVLKPLLHDPRWTEVILLTAGHLGESSQYRATQFVKTILSAGSEYEDILHHDLLLAARCLADDVRVDAPVRRTTFAKLLKLYLDPESPYALQEDIRQIFARLGGTSVEKDVLAALTGRLTDSNGNVRAAAALALGQLGTVAVTPEVIAALLRCLADSEWYVREAAAKAIGQMGQAAATPEVVSVLLRLLTDLKSTVRTAAAWALGQMGQAAVTPEVLSVLLGRLSDPMWEVCSGAADALGQLRARAANPGVISTLLRHLTSSARLTRGAAAGVLGQLGQVAATPEVLTTLLKCFTDADAHIRGTAARALGRLVREAAKPEVLEMLLKYLDSPEREVRRAAVEALGQIGQMVGTQEVLSALLKLLADPEEYVRAAAAEALGQLGPAAATPEVVMTLLKHFADPEGNVRWAAAGALGQMGAAAATPEVMAALLKCLTDAEWFVRRAAVEALRNLSAYVHSQERPEVMKLFLSLTRSRDADSRETGYVGLRNLLAGEHSEAAQA
jgi:HEAT repeat protein